MSVYENRWKISNSYTPQLCTYFQIQNCSLIRKRVLMRIPLAVFLTIFASGRAEGK